MPVPVKANGTGYSLTTAGDVNHAGIFNPDVSAGVPKISAFKVGRIVFVVVHGNPTKSLTKGTWYEIPITSHLSPQTGFLQDLWYNGHHCQMEVTDSKYRFRSTSYDMNTSDFFSETFTYMANNSDNT